MRRDIWIWNSRDAWDFRICCYLNCCKRWYFTFNGIECSKPITIEAIDAIHQNQGKTDTNLHKHSQIGGYCEEIGKNTVRVGLVVGDCLGFKSGSNAYTGYHSVARIIIEEVPNYKPQRTLKENEAFHSLVYSRCFEL